MEVEHLDWLEGRRLAAIARYEYIARFGWIGIVTLAERKKAEEV